MMKWLQILLSAVLLAGITGCVQLAESGQSALILTSPAQEAQIGKEAFLDIKKSRKVSPDTAIKARVQRVVDHLVPVLGLQGMTWEVVVFEDDTPNAFALPGGKIGVHTGILPVAQTDDGLAAVLGHELAHVVLRHGGQRMTQQVLISGAATLAQYAMQNGEEDQRQLTMAAFGAVSTLGIALPYSRSHEYEADKFGLFYMAKAGYDPDEAIEFWKRMQKASDRGRQPMEWLSTHPSDQNRIQRLRMLVPQARVQQQNYERLKKLRG